ncbi:hypothetical protein V6N13_059056 [Hibiscus sabdariffa]|uniref:Uncharacterized protein n=1 Tax=Hibiscus sabdariffa TaxID=183260 RepID=A0ABR2GEC9_9ROSI
MDIVVQNSVPSESNMVFIQKIWEDNRRDDWRVMGTSSWLAKENVRMVQWNEENCSDHLVLSIECNLETSLRVTKQPSDIGLDDQMDNGLT